MSETEDGAVGDIMTGPRANQARPPQRHTHCRHSGVISKPTTNLLYKKTKMIRIHRGPAGPLDLQVFQWLMSHQLNLEGIINVATPTNWVVALSVYEKKNVKVL